MRSLLLCLALSGCANGVVMTEAETVACRNEGCNVFTEREFLQFMGKVFKEGYLNGWADSNKQGGRNL